MYKRMLEKLSWKNPKSSHRLILKCILVFPIAKMFWTWCTTFIEGKLKIFRPLSPIGQARNPLNPPIPAYVDDT